MTKVLLLLHILSAFVAFGPMFVIPAVARTKDVAAVGNLYLRMMLPALVLTWVFGMALEGTNDQYSLGQLWLWLAMVIWVGMVAVGWFIIKPALTSSSSEAKAKLSMGVGITHLGMLVSLILMIWRPGLGG